jgi:ubiquinone/menaquinone biosynthesis C-methylase UbiE
MKFSEKRANFIDRTARKPSGQTGIKMYKDPKAHYKSFNIILNKLKLSPEDEYLEIGCGGGVLLKKALETVAFAAAIDHSPDMVELSKEKTREYAEKTEIIQGDAGQLPWTDGRFSAAASANMFFFVEEPQKVLNEVYRILNPGGRFVMVTMGKGILGTIIFGWLYSLRTYSDKQMIAMLEQAGFSTIKVNTQFGIPHQICYAEKQ